MSDFRTIWIRKYLGSGPFYVFDIGSYDASDAIRIKKRYPESEVYSFEASKKNYEKVKNNASKYNINHRNIALSDAVGEMEFYESEGSSDASGSILKPSEKLNAEGIFFKNKYLVKAQTIDTFCEENAINKIDVAHIDVQGAEMKVMTGASKVKVRMVFAEVSEEESYEGGYRRSDFDAFMKTKGYCLVRELMFDSLYLRDEDYMAFKKKRIRAVYYEILEYLENVLRKLHFKILIVYNKLYVKKIRKMLFGY